MDDDSRQQRPGPAGGSGRRHVDLSPEQLVTLAHPIRSRLLSALRTGGPATASVLALRLGTNSGTTSYHLRRLAEVGLIEDAPEHGDGRDRWWRPAQESHSFSAQNHPGDADAVAASDWLHEHYLRLSHRRAEDWAEQRREWPAPWRSAATMSDWALHLTPEQLTAMNVEIDAVIERWRGGTDPGDPAAERVAVILYDFPEPDLRA